MNFLKDLIETPSISGNERTTHDLIKHELKEVRPMFQLKGLYNLAAIANDCGNITILLDAHVDVVGFQVNYISSDGYVYLRTCGAIDLDCMLCQKVTIHGHKEIRGVIGKLPIHMTIDKEDKTNDVLYVDTGVRYEELCQLVTPGDFVSIDTSLENLTQSKLTAAGLDNKAGVYVGVEAFKRLASSQLKSRLVFLASNEEEAGGIVVTACNAINPDIAIVIDVDLATDYPGCLKTKYGDISLGKGPIITRNLDSNSLLTAKAIQIAKENNIPIQISSGYRSTGGNNSSFIRRSHSGVKTLVIGLPCRYLHTPIEVVDETDLQLAVNLIVKIVEDLDSAMDVVNQ